MRVQSVLWIFVFALACAHGALAKDIALVSHKDNAAKNMPLSDLVKICKGQTGRWPDGRLLTLITRDPASSDMHVVLQKVYGMSPEEVADLIASANHDRTDRPAIVVVNSDELVVKRVESTPGAVGLVDVYSITSGVNVLRVGGKLPLEPGYPLHGN
jgi:ABC-type phosphate transport system substrate-binding protein